MILQRQQIVQAIVYWGEHGSPVEEGSKLTVEAGKLVDVLGTMDFQRQAAVELGDDSERAQLVRAALPA